MLVFQMNKTPGLFSAGLSFYLANIKLFMKGPKTLN